MEWNKVIYADCMNEENGLPTLEDKSVDLCITDPPWNINFKGVIAKCSGPSSTKKYEFYNDKIENYKEWCISWFNEIKRISNMILLTPGRQNLKLWYRISDPLDILFHYKKNGGYGGKLSLCNLMDIILYYGNSFAKPPYLNNVFAIIANWGFLKKRGKGYEQSFLHPAPKNYELWYKLIDGLSPKSVLDPFIGSGTTAEVCTKLGIPWMGYEINEVYSQDINNRLKNCKREPKQIELKLT